MKIILGKYKLFFVMLIFLFVVLIFRFSFSYFEKRESNIADTKSGVGGSVAEKLIFENGDSINISATLENFENGDGSLKDDTISTVSLVPGSDTGAAEVKYSVYYDIKVNDFVYSVGEDKPELLLKIIGPDNEEVRNIFGLNYKTVIDAHTSEVLSGYDITEFSGLLEIKEEYIIETEGISTTIDEWEIFVTFVNLDSPQNANFNKSFEADLILSKNKIVNSEEVFSEFSELVLINEGGINTINAKGSPDLLVTSIVDEGMYSTVDSYGTTYYYRGAVEDNWVFFGGYFWRIMRINGDGSVRLIYTGERSPNFDEKVYPTGSDTILGSTYVDFWGYKKAVSDPSTDLNLHANELDSVAKTYLDEWYSGTGSFSDIKYKLINYSEYIADNYFCGDRTWAINDHNSSWVFEKALMDRKEIGTYTYICPNKLDAYTVLDSVNGNATLDYPIGTLSGDDFGFAGLVWGTENKNNFLSSDISYVSMSPMLKSNYSNYYFFHGYKGGSDMQFNSITVYYVTNSSQINNGIRPVINIKGDTLFTGTGTWDDPYRM